MKDLNSRKHKQKIQDAPEGTKFVIIAVNDSDYYSNIGRVFTKTKNCCLMLEDSDYMCISDEDDGCIPLGEYTIDFVNKVKNLPNV